MSISLGSFDFPNLTAQPYGFDATNIAQGLSARKWNLSGFLTPSEWLDLLQIYEDWRDLRIEDEDSASSGVVGTTVELSGTGPDGQTWTDIACWFLTAPEAEINGKYFLATVEVVDAAQALQVLLREQEQEAEDTNLPDLGTITIGSATLTLLKPPDTYTNTPSVEPTVVGKQYIAGPLAVYRIKDVEGTTNAAGWEAVLDWYESTVMNYPSSGDLFPVSAPTASARNVVVSGVNTVEYTVTIQLAEII